MDGEVHHGGTDDGGMRAREGRWRMEDEGTRGKRGAREVRAREKGARK